MALVALGMWDLPRSRIESMSPASAGGFLSREALTIDISNTPLPLQKSLQANPMLITEVHSPRIAKEETDICIEPCCLDSPKNFHIHGGSGTLHSHLLNGIEKDRADWGFYVHY